MPEVRLIDANAMRNEWLEYGENEYVYDTNAVLASIDEQPTLSDYEPVIHAYWMDDAYCSNCRASKPKPCAAYLEPKANTRCHVCGAKMDLKS